MISVIIKTINRTTLINSIKSAEAAGFKDIIVVSDGPFDYSLVDGEFDSYLSNDMINLIELGKRFGKYGCMAANVGAMIAKNDWICFLDDDDEFVPNAKKIMEDKIRQNPDVKLWFSGIQLNDGRVLGNTKQVSIIPGTVSHPVYFRDILCDIPFSHQLSAIIQDKDEYIDFAHMLLAGQIVKYDWFEEILYNLRPQLQGTNGRGK